MSTNGVGGFRPPANNFAATNTQTTPRLNVEIPLGDIDPKSTADLTRLAEPINNLLGPEQGEKYAVFYAQQLAGLGKTFKDAAIKKVTADMDAWAKDPKNADKGIEEFQKEFKTKLSNAIMVQSTFKQHINQMAQQAIDRMKDTFEG